MSCKEHLFYILTPCYFKHSFVMVLYTSTDQNIQILMLETKEDIDLLDESWHPNALVWTKSAIFVHHCHDRRARVLHAFITLHGQRQTT